MAIKSMMHTYLTTVIILYVPDNYYNIIYDDDNLT